MTQNKIAKSLLKVLFTVMAISSAVLLTILFCYDEKMHTEDEGMMLFKALRLES